MAMTFAGINDCRKAIEAQGPWETRDRAKTLYGLLSDTRAIRKNNAVSYQDIFRPKTRLKP
jgi:fatty-acyl-CoA synthase/long-chain acyl-CoA synthetase